jgi:hypothetical protein
MSRKKEIQNVHFFGGPSSSIGSEKKVTFRREVAFFPDKIKMVHNPT